MTKETHDSANDSNGSRDGGYTKDTAIKLIEYRIGQLELRVGADEAETERRRDAVDKTLDRVEGSLQTALHRNVAAVRKIERRVDWLVARVITWATVIAAIVGYVAEHYSIFKKD